MFASLIEECRSAVLNESLARSLKDKQERQATRSRTVHSRDGDSDDDHDDEGSDEDEKKARTAFSKQQLANKEAKSAQRHRMQQRFSAQKRHRTMKAALQKISSAASSKSSGKPSAASKAKP